MARKNILLGLSGSVASIKAKELCEALSVHGTVRVVLTKHALAFVDTSNESNANTRGSSEATRTDAHNDTLSNPAHGGVDCEALAAYLRCESVHIDENEWHTWQRIGDNVLHTSLRDWASILVVAPLSANTLVKLCTGQCDNLLTCIVRAWCVERPIVLAPAMNTFMWTASCTAEHMERVRRIADRVCIVWPIVKRLACGQYGTGAMASVASISDECAKSLHCRQTFIDDYFGKPN